MFNQQLLCHQTISALKLRLSAITRQKCWPLMSLSSFWYEPPFHPPIGAPAIVLFPVWWELRGSAVTPSHSWAGETVVYSHMTSTVGFASLLLLTVLIPQINHEQWCWLWGLSLGFHHSCVFHKTLTLIKTLFHQLQYSKWRKGVFSFLSSRRGPKNEWDLGLCLLITFLLTRLFLVIV